MTSRKTESKINAANTANKLSGFFLEAVDGAQEMAQAVSQSFAPRVALAA